MILNQGLVEINVSEHLVKTVTTASPRGGINYFLQNRMWQTILVKALSITFNIKKASLNTRLKFGEHEHTHTHTHTHTQNKSLKDSTVNASRVNQGLQ